MGLAEASLIVLLVAGLIAGTAFAAQGGGGGGGKSCTPNAPRVAIENTWAWGSWGSFGMAGQQLQYQVSVTNYDVGCRASSFSISVDAPAGFAVSVPTNTISLKSGKTGYLSAWVTSPSGIADGNYPIAATAVRTGTTGAANASGSFTSYYKVYSSDSVAPTLFWPSPGNGQAISGRSYNVSVSSNDDHAVKTISLSIDGVQLTTTKCDDISYTCSLSYRWTTTPGSHTATFTATDWMQNHNILTVSFTAS